MFKSLGIDSLRFRVQIPSEHIRNLRVIRGANPHAAKFEVEKGIWVHEQKAGYVTIGGSIAKFLYGHNIKLVDSPAEVKRALDVISSSTGIDLMNADLISADITLCYASPYTFAEEITAFELEKKGYETQTQSNGVYFNSIDIRHSEQEQHQRKSRLVILLYDKKAEYLKNTRRKRLPSGIALGEGEHLFRIEVRLQRILRSQLKKAGVWSSSSIIGSDLFTNKGFLSLIRFFETRVPSFLILPRRRGIRTKSYFTKRIVLYSEIFREQLVSEWYMRQLIGMSENKEIEPSLFDKEMERIRIEREGMIGERLLNLLKTCSSELYRSFPYEREPMKRFSIRTRKSRKAG